LTSINPKFGISTKCLEEASSEVVEEIVLTNGLMPAAEVQL
jgi:hypothetical protein